MQKMKIVQISSHFSQIPPNGAPQNGEWSCDQSSGSGKINGSLIVQHYMLEVQHTTFLYSWGGANFQKIGEGGNCPPSKPQLRGEDPPLKKTCA
jgi:hypothetical protein